jgi:sigma-B regulation protein RsbU (phosphoserine phosphatase)
MKKSKLSHRITWRVIGIMSFFNVLIIGAILLFVFRVSLMNSDMRGQYVVDGIEGKIESLLWAVHVGADNNRDEIERNMGSPEQVFDALEHEISVNEFLGCFAAFEPDYFQGQGCWFEAYLYHTDSTHLERKQIGSQSHDYFNGPWYQKGISLDRQGLGYLTTPYFDNSIDSAMYCSYVLPIVDPQGRKVGVYGVDLDYLWLNEVFGEVEKMVKREFLDSNESIQSSNGTIHFSVQIIDSKGNRVLGSDSLDLNILKAKQEEVFDNLGMKDLKDTPYYASFKPVPFTDWTVVVIQHRNLVFAWGMLLAIIILACMGVGCMVIFFFTSRSIHHATKPLGFLSESAQEVAKGNFSAPLPSFKYNDEVAQLSHSFGNMQQSLVKYIEDLKDATAQKALIESDLRIASKIQMGMLPVDFPTRKDRDDVQLFASLTPAKAVGGDLFDFYFRDDKLFFCIGDVSGKGVPASLFMAVTRSTFRTVSAQESMPDRIITTMNKTIADMNKTYMFVTLFVGVLDLPTGHLYYCNAGHDAPLLVGAGTGELPCDPNIPVGFMPKWKYSLQEAQIYTGTTIFLFTDGLTEAMDVQKNQFQIQRVKNVAEQALAQGQQAPQQLISLMTDAVHQFVGDAEQSDDLTMMGIQYKMNCEL